MSQHQERRDKRERAAEQQRGRTTAEWVTLGISLLIALVVVGLLIYDLVGGSNGPPLIAITPDYAGLREEGDVYYLPVTVTNEGGQTAEDVTIHFVLAYDGGSESSSLTFRFLAPGEKSSASLIFNANPATGALRHTTNYLDP